MIGATTSPAPAPAIELNAAQQLLASLGISWARRPGTQKSSSWTKRGPGRYHQKLTKRALFQKQRTAMQKLIAAHGTGRVSAA